MTARGHSDRRDGSRRPSWLIVVDAQNGFVNDQSDHVVDPLAAFLRRWNAGGDRVLATRFVNTPGSQWERLMSWVAMSGPPETGLDPAIQSAVDADSRNVVVDKHTYTSLTPEALAVMELRPREAVCVCGLDTDACVLATALDLFERGMTPTVLTDLCASSGGNVLHQAGLMVLSRLIGQDALADSSEIT